MTVSWINSFTSFSNYSLPIVKDKILLSLGHQQKRIAAVVLVALGCLTAGYLLYRFCCCKTTRNDMLANLGPADNLGPQVKRQEAHANEVGFGAVALTRLAYNYFSSSLEPFDLRTLKLQDRDAAQRLLFELTGHGEDNLLETIEDLNRALESFKHYRDDEALDKSHFTKPERWKDEAVIRAYSKRIEKVTLETDLMLARLALEHKDAKDPAQAIASAIGSQSSPDYLQYLSLSTNYHYARNSVTFFVRDRDDLTNKPRYCRGKCYPDFAKEDFYDPTKPQDGWRRKYNRFCRIVAPINSRILTRDGSKDDRYGNWTQPDDENYRYPKGDRPS
jgi:hypothetical protein